ncbi:MAG: hypothetical protein ABIA04_14930 [Pseudomonadota bacterium]
MTQKKRKYKKRLFIKLLLPVIFTSIITVGTLLTLSYFSYVEAQRAIDSLKIEDTSEENLEKTYSISKVLVLSVRKNIVITSFVFLILLFFSLLYIYFRVIIPIKLIRNHASSLLNLNYIKEYFIFTSDEIEDLERSMVSISDLIEKNIKYQDVSRNLIGDIALLKDQINEIIRQESAELIPGPYQNPLNELVEVLADIIKKLKLLTRKSNEVHESGTTLGNELISKTIDHAKDAERSFLEIRNMKNKFNDINVYNEKCDQFFANLTKSLKMDIDQMLNLSKGFEQLEIIFKGIDNNKLIIENKLNSMDILILTLKNEIKESDLNGKISEALDFVSENILEGKNSLGNLNKLEVQLKQDFGFYKSYIEKLSKKDKIIIQKTNEYSLLNKKIKEFLEVLKELSLSVASDNKSKMIESIKYKKDLDKLQESLGSLKEEK